jgi:beta-mannosidase
MTVGPWKSVFLHTYQSRISDLDIRTAFNGDSIKVDVNVEVSPAAEGKAVVTLPGLSKTFEAHFDKNGVAKASLDLNMKDVELWYPVGYGTQKLYDIEVKAHDSVSARRYMAHALLKC